MRTLVTGGAGFIGSHLVDRLLEQGDQIVILDDLSTGRHDNIRHLASNQDVEFIRGSILNSDLVDDAVRRVDRVFHLAAAVGVNLIVQRPLESLETNIRGSDIVLEKCHKYGRKVLVTSTSEIYGKNTSDALHEDDDRILGSPLKARWSYSAAKSIEEVLAYTYWSEKGLPTVIARLFNTVGPRQVGNYGMVVPRLIDQALRGAPITVYGEGTQTRCFCHVADSVGALIGLMDDRAAEGRVFNVGNADEISMLQLAETIRTQLGSSSEIALVPYEQAYEPGFEDMQRRRPDTTRIHDLLGWEPTRTLAQIIDDVATDLRTRIA
ncbi:MAG: GDP-mannose 4,6-dehydratase [Candidatus Nanopelagicales bacterium]|nr:GDP-mannose 4,6-dehydratase [Candidatus Nanopelagicales bacterium]